ncbi:xanthine dehydrogenase accessory protein XdhC [Amylibacter kogurei]|uniref:Xanthine dehydrogenase accessory protein XdhC n=1 Tax=Paramylibacter kogurei TaxID=1889778 RepID=A0A2G5K5B4_9RHOB|nr:xanthine dehydrogenase accessory protein XdhC [Amylibacter kogurei]PIB24708.1 xanthine dehydrogenase accessory protein XdhC [Amylibacter kogurei]
MHFDREHIAQLIQNGDIVRVVIATDHGSVPRATGTSMIVTRDRQIGTIGGGALELHGTEIAREMLADGGDKRAVKIPLGPALAQCCGGAVTLVFERFSLENLPENDIVFARAIATNDMSLDVKRILANIRNQSMQPNTIYRDGWLIEPMKQIKQPLWLYGAGHVGRALVNVLHELAFDITWVDTAKDRFPDQIAKGVTPLIASNPAMVAKHAPKSAVHLIMTYSHAFDLELCHQILNIPHQSVGVIGSKTKRTRFCKRLAQLGHSTSDIDKLICPIGDPNLGKEPAAIAIGIAQMLITSQNKTAKTAVAI